MGTLARSREGLRSPRPWSHIASPLVYVTVKVPCSAEQLLVVAGTHSPGRAPSRLDTASMTHLHWGATRARLRR